MMMTIAMITMTLSRPTGIMFAMMSGKRVTT